MLKSMGNTLAGIAIVLLLQGCAAAIVGGAATTAVVAHDRRTTGIIVEDQSIELKAYDALAKAPDTKQSTIHVTSYNKVVLLTGQASSEAVRKEVGEIVGKVAQVRRVVNELEIGSTASLGEDTRDVALTTEVKLRLTKVKLPDFDPLRVKVVTERGVVFLMGLLTQQEAQAVTDEVRYISGVRRVVKVFEYI